MAECKNPDCIRPARDPLPYCCGACAVSQDDGDRAPGHTPMCDHRNGVEPPRGRSTGAQAVIDTLTTEESP